MGGVHASGLTALAVRDLADGAYADAYALLKPFVDDPFLQVTPLEYPDFVEAAVRSDRRDDALPVVARLEEIAAANGSPWARGAAERCRALVDDDAAERHFEAALDAFAPTGHRHRARPHPPAVRRVAAPGAAPPGRPRAPAPGRGDLRRGARRPPSSTGPGASSRRPAPPPIRRARRGRRS